MSMENYVDEDVTYLACNINILRMECPSNKRTFLDYYSSLKDVKRIIFFCIFFYYSQIYMFYPGPFFGLFHLHIN